MIQNNSKGIVMSRKLPKSIENKAKQIMDIALNKYNKLTEAYYEEVLQFLNLLFDEDAQSIKKLKLKKISINEIIFDMYNDIITKYKLNFKLFNKSLFTIEEMDEHDQDLVIKIVKIMGCNVLYKLNYGLRYGVSKTEKNKQFKLIELFK